MIFDGQRIRNFPNDRKLQALRKFLEANFELQKVVLIFEPTGPYSGHLVALAGELSLSLYVINPAQAHWFSKALGNRRKDDLTDARALYSFAQLFLQRGISPIKVTQSLVRLSQLLSAYRFIQKQAQALSNHIEALSFSDEISGELLEKLTEEQKRLEVLKQEAFKKAKDEALKDEKMKEEFARLQTISGVGEKVALWLVWLFNRYKGTDRRQIVALCGLDVVEKQSGSSVKGRPHISKRGVSAVRAILYFPTFAAIKYNPAIGAFYHRLVGRGKKPKLAVVAAMRKLLLVAYAVWKSGQTWNRQLAIDYACNLSLDCEDSI